jgi:hypothetical protein
MIETLSRTIRRSAPAISHAADQGLFDGRASRTARTPPDGKKRQQKVRSFLRLRLLQMRGKEFHFPARPAQLALVEINGPRRARRGMGIVRHHDDRLAVLAVERLEQIQNLIPGLAVQVARRLVAQQHGRVGDNRAGDAHPLLFAAGQRAGIMFGAVGQADHGQRRLHVFLALRLGQVRQQQRQFHVSFRVQHRHQVVKLKNEADVPRAPMGQLPVGKLVNALAADLTVPLVGRSRPPIKLSSVLLPDPDGPISARNSPRVHIARLKSASTWISSDAAMEDFFHPLHPHQRAVFG